MRWSERWQPGGGVDARRAEVIASALTADAFDPAGCHPLLGYVLGNAERVTFDVGLVVVDDAPPVADAHLDLLLAHVVLEDHEVGGSNAASNIYQFIAETRLALATPRPGAICLVSGYFDQIAHRGQ